MNHLAEQKETGLAIAPETAQLIQQGIAPSTLKRYRTLSLRLETWLDGRLLTDALLASYITELHQQGKSPATINQVVVTVNASPFLNLYLGTNAGCGAIKKFDRNQSGLNSK